MKRRTLLLTASLSPLLAAPALGQASLGPILDDAAGLENLRAIAVWQGGREIAARGYHGFTPDDPTNIKSASKSIISALAGIAIDRGELEGTDQPIAPILRDQLPADPDPRLATVTLGHLLSMQAGWNGSLARITGPGSAAATGCALPLPRPSPRIRAGECSIRPPRPTWFRLF